MVGFNAWIRKKWGNNQHNKTKRRSNSAANRPRNWYKSEHHIQIKNVIRRKRKERPAASSDDFDLSAQESLSKKQLNQLRELLWLEQAYNLIFLGPPGVGKTCLSIGIGIEAINHGYQVSFVQMNELIRLLKTEEISRISRAKIKRMVGSDLVIIDDLMFMAIDRHEANLFFQLINQLYGQTSIIITSNKGPEEWGDILGDPAITTAILDRLIHKSEVIHLTGDSYRLKHRQTIFGNN